MDGFIIKELAAITCIVVVYNKVSAIEFLYTFDEMRFERTREEREKKLFLEISAIFLTRRQQYNSQPVINFN